MDDTQILDERLCTFLLRPVSLFLIFFCSIRTLLWSHQEVVPVELHAIDLTCLHGPGAAHQGMPVVGLPSIGKFLHRNVCMTLSLKSMLFWGSDV